LLGILLNNYSFQKQAISKVENRNIDIVFFNMYFYFVWNFIK